MAERRGRRRGLEACIVVLLVVAVVSSACTQGVPEGRVDEAASEANPPGTGQTGGAGDRTQSGTGDTSTIAVTTAPLGRPATNAGNICRGRADSFLPDAATGYSIDASGDISGMLPPGAVGIQSAGGALVRRNGDRAEGLVSAVVFDEQPALTAVASSTVDILLQAVGGKADVTDTTVNGYEARTTSGPDGATVVAWPECLNVWVLVRAPDAAMATDLASQAHSP